MSERSDFFGKVMSNELLGATIDRANQNVSFYESIKVSILEYGRVLGLFGDSKESTF